MGTHMMKTVFISTFLGLAFSCKLPMSSNDDSGPNNVVSNKADENTIYTGLDLDGSYRSCKQISALVACTEIFGPDEIYANECEANGDLAITCDCHDYICVDENLSLPFYGKDINGNVRSCEAMAKDTMCTMVFTEGDQFALDCEESGGTALQCGCHDYICLN